MTAIKRAEASDRPEKVTAGSLPLPLREQQKDFTIMTQIPPYKQQLEQAASIAREELSSQPAHRITWDLKEEASWYGVRETFPVGLHEEVLQQAADRVMSNLVNPKCPLC